MDRRVLNPGSELPEFFDSLAVLQKTIQYSFRQLHLLIEALTHKSVLVDWGRTGDSHALVKQVYEGLGIRQISWNERLEFLGDSVLGLAVSSLLVGRAEGFEEGKLSKIRAALVNETFLADKARAVNLDRCIILSRSEERAGGRERSSILGDAFEALLGAIYQDSDFQVVKRVVAELYADVFQGDLRRFLITDYKSLLQEHVQQRWKIAPTYETVGESGPDHCKRFTVAVHIAGSPVAVAEGVSKKAASQGAAQFALSKVADVASVEELHKKGQELCYVGLSPL